MNERARSRQIADDRKPRNGREVLSPRGEPFEVLGRAGPVERRGAPPIPAEAREELLVLKDGELFLCARTNGDVAPARVPSLQAFELGQQYRRLQGVHPRVVSGLPVQVMR